MKRREFITLIGGAAAAWPLAARAQQPPLPTVAFISGRSSEDDASYGAAFRNGLNETGIIAGQNATVEYHWLDGRYNQLPSIIADLVRRRVAVIATPGSAPATHAAKAASADIPLVFGVAEDPVRTGLVASLARPGGNATGINFFVVETVAKQLSLLHELLPQAVRVAVLVNPSNPQSTLRAVSDAARALGLEIQVLEASTSREIEAAFATLVCERAEALFIAPDAFLGSRRVQFAILAARNGIPAAGIGRDAVEIGLLMNYGTDLFETYRQVGIYTGRILKGAKPADLPVIQSTKFELSINLITAKAFGIEIPASLLAITDRVIE
jgi:putative ABC transport system substrate-binding protein